MRRFYAIFIVHIYLLFAAVDLFAQCGTTPISGDLIISANTSLSGTYNVSGLFRVEAGVTVTVTPYSSNFCGELIINAAQVEVIGDILADGAGYTGGTGGNGGAAGNNVGALTGCIDKDNCLVIDVNGGAVGAAGSGPGAGAIGTAGAFGLGPKQTCQNWGDDFGFVPGAGGAGGSGGGSYGAAALGGGSGGSGAAYNAGNFSGMGYAGCATPVAGSGGTGGTVAVAYGTANGTDIDLGSGGAGAGGGGKSATNGAAGGAGGAGGGLVALYSTGSMSVLGTVSANGTVGAAGGTGGNGGTTTDCCEDGCNDCAERTFSSGAGGGGGAGGGSGGGILLEAYGPAVITGTLRAKGGNGGTGGAGGAGHGGCSYNGTWFCIGTDNSGSSNAGAAGNLGGGGSGGRVKIFRNPCQTNTINADIQLLGGNGNSGQAGPGTSFSDVIGNIVAPTVSSTADSVSCFGLSDGAGAVTVSGGLAPFDYVWSPIGGTAASASGLPAGSYDVTVTDANGCVVVETVEIGEPILLTAQIYGTIDADCYAANTGEASAQGLGGTAPYSYAWDDPQSQITATATNLPAGTWNVTVLDANGCSATGSATLGQPIPFAASLNIDQSVSCFGGSNGQATVTANGNNLSYLWNDPQAQTTATATGLMAGNYTCTVSTSQTCDTVITVVITEPAELTLLAVQNQAVSCSGGNDGVALVTQLGGTGPFAYQWDDSNLQTTPSASGLTAGTYNVVVTDNNGCTETASVTISQPAPISIAVDIENAACFGQASASVEAIVTGGTGPYAYLWTPGNLSGSTISNVAAGVYSVLVTDAHGCTQTFANILVQQPTELSAALTQQEDVSCNGLADGSANVTVTGGTPAYTYLWDDPSGQTGASASGLAPGTYSVLITDDNGCTTTVSDIEVTEPSVLEASVSSSVPVTCLGGADGMAETSVTGGTGPYTYLWDDADAQTGSTASGLMQGTYTVTVTDANGCTTQVQATIDSPVNVLTAGFNITPETGQQPLDITVFNTSVGGTAFEWFFGDGNTLTTFDTDSFQYTYMDSGSFTIMLVAYNDSTGCSDTLSFTDGVYIEPTSLIIVPNVITPNGDGLNDIFPIDPTNNDFFPYTIRNIINFKGEIYNRWGEKVFEWTQPLGGWDGRTTSGLELGGGTYYYVITCKGIDGDPPYTDYEFKGNVTLIR